MIRSALVRGWQVDRCQAECLVIEDASRFVAGAFSARNLRCTILFALPEGDVVSKIITALDFIP
jgi:hypothetical protein